MLTNKTIFSIIKATLKLRKTKASVKLSESETDRLLFTLKMLDILSVSAHIPET